MLKVGERAPDFRVELIDGRAVSLGDFAGKHLVVYFFPKAFTPGCTKEARRFRDNYPELRTLGAEVLGVSMDDANVQCRFAEAERVTFPMVSDASGEFVKKFGVKLMFLPIARRVTFVVDPARKVVARFAHDFQVNRHLDDVLAFLRGRTELSLPTR
jgi:peroxiredoxin